MDEQRKWLLEMGATPGEDAVKIVDMATKDLECYKTQLVKQQQVVRGLTPISKEVLLWVKCYPMALYAVEKSLVKGRVNRCCKLNCLILRSCHSLPAFSSPHPDQSAASNIEAKSSTTKKITTW